MHTVHVHVHMCTCAHVHMCTAHVCALPPAGAAAGRVVPPAWHQHGPLPRRADPANLRPSVRLGAQPPHSLTAKLVLSCTSTCTSASASTSTLPLPLPLIPIITFALTFASPSPPAPTLALA